MLTLYLVRHGQTDHSRENSFAGSIDVDLTDLGRQMAVSVADHLAELPIAAVWASTKHRAIETARPLAERKALPVRTDEGLCEISYGQWEGMNEEEVQQSQPAAFKAWHDHPDVVSPPGGETGYQILARATAAIERIRTATPEGNVVIVSHKATLRLLLCHFLGVPIGDFRRRIGMPVCAISAVKFRSTGPIIEFMSDTAHLPPALKKAAGT
jgi:probable phosphoglycerate mutase